MLRQRDSFIELSELVEKGEKAKIYNQNIPNGILSEVFIFNQLIRTIYKFVSFLDSRS